MGLALLLSYKVYSMYILNGLAACTCFHYPGEMHGLGIGSAVTGPANATACAATAGRWERSIGADLGVLGTLPTGICWYK